MRRRGASGERLHLDDRTTTVSEYSRSNAAGRYSSAQRHASRGDANVLERLRSGIEDRTGGRRIRKGRVAALVLVALLVVCLAGGGIWYAQVSASMQPGEDVSGSVVEPAPGEPYYVLLLGSDKRPKSKEPARADSIMLCRVDESAKKVTLVSLPRDLRVEIAGQGMGKLNSAITFNGVSGMIDAVSDVAGVPISYYAIIYFSGFKQLVNDLGGVTVEVPEGTYYKGVTVPAGKESHINGKEALVLARCRHGNPPDQGAYAAGDYQRTKNQRNLMKAIVKKIMKQPIFMVPGQVLSVSKCIETNMPASKLAGIAFAMRGMDADSMYTTTAPAGSSYIGGVSYQILDETAWPAMMERVKAGQDPSGD